MPQCAKLAAMKNRDDIYDHMNSFCIECVEAQLTEVANGEELIFTDGREPSWIAAQQAREAEAKEEQARAEVAAKKRAAIERKKERAGEAKTVNWASAEEAKKEEIRRLAGQNSDKHLEYQIKRIMRVDDSEAAQMRLELKREIAMKRKEKEKEQEKVEVKQQIKQEKQEQKRNPDAPKELNKFQKRPWQPAILKAIAIDDERRSALDAAEQKRYVAIISNFHQLEKSARFEQNKMDLKMYDDRLLEEREIVEAMVKERLAGENVSMKEVEREVQHVMTRWQSRYLNDRRRFDRLKGIPWGREAEVPLAQGVLKPNLERLLMAAPNPKLTLPNIHDRIPVHFDPYRFDPRNKRGGNTIANDEVVRTLCVDNGCSFAMDATTAVHLMSRPGEPRNYAYNVPINVMDQFRGGSLIRVCVLGKPRPQGGVSNRTLLQLVAKYRAKSTFTAKAEESHAKPSTSKDTVAPTGGDTVGTNGLKKEGEGGGGGGLSLLDDLLGSITSSLLPSSAALATAAGAAAPAKQSTTSHSYGLFTIPSYSQPLTKVLIRHSPCAVYAPTGGTEYALAAKVEMAPDAGVTKETFEEMLWTSMKTLFKGAVNSATVHLHPYVKDGLQISHSRAVPQGNQYNEGFFPLLSTRTEHFARLLAELQQLQAGEYLLQVSPLNEELTLFRENPRGNEMFFNKTPRRLPGPVKPLDHFTCIDNRRVLHWQSMQSRVPLSLWPKGHPILQTRNKEIAKRAQLKAPKKPPQPPPRSQMTEEERKQHNAMKKKQQKARKRMRVGGASADGEGGGASGGGGGGGGQVRDWDAPSEGQGGPPPAKKECN